MGSALPTTRDGLEAELIRARRMLTTAEAQAEGRKRRVDELIRALRALPDPPSARSIAQLAGVSDVEVLRIAKRPG